MTDDERKAATEARLEAVARACRESDAAIRSILERRRRYRRGLCPNGSLLDPHHLFGADGRCLWCGRAQETPK